MEWHFDLINENVLRRSGIFYVSSSKYGTMLHFRGGGVELSNNKEMNCFFH